MRGGWPARGVAGCELEDLAGILGVWGKLERFNLRTDQAKAKQKGKPLSGRYTFNQRGGFEETRTTIG